MTSKKKTFVIGWIGVVVAGLALFYWTSVRTTGTSSRQSSRIAVFDFDTVNGPIQPIPLRANLDPKKVALGRRLFDEPRLSADNTIPCSFCHNLRKGGADSRVLSEGVSGAMGVVNSPTVFNSVFNTTQFWDGRVATLEEQVAGPLTNPKEMAASWSEVVGKLKSDPSYVAQFEEAFSTGISEASITEAIATFERSLITPNSRLDQYLRGNDSSLTPQEKEGYELFNDLGCVVCHQGVNVGGTLFQKMGKMADYFDGRELRQADLGRYNVTGKERDRFVFKVPGLRNVELTAPYFHDGSAETLEEAVTVMARVQLGFDLSPREVDLLVDFLQTLTADLAETPS